MVGDFGYAKFKETPRGKKLLDIVSGHTAEIAILAKHGVPPVKAIDQALAAFEKVEGPLTDSEKQFVGRMVFEELGVDAWEVSGRQEFEGAVFVSGSTFRLRDTRLVTIRRKDPRPGGEEYPIRSAGGYQLVRGGLKPEERTLVDNAVFVRKLEEAIPLLDAGYHIRMGRKGVRPSLIAKESLIIE